MRSKILCLNLIPPDFFWVKVSFLLAGFYEIIIQLREKIVFTFEILSSFSNSSIRSFNTENIDFSISFNFETHLLIQVKSNLS